MTSIRSPSSPTYFERESALKVLEAARQSLGLSTRALAAKAGHSSHAMVSRVLSGHKPPSASLVATLCEVLRIEGRQLDTVLGGLAPRLARVAGQARGVPLVRSDARRTSNTRFFLDVHAPLVYEALKILEEATPASLAASFQGPLRLGEGTVLKALNHLRSLDYATENDGTWRLRGEPGDVVIPSHSPAAAALENVRASLKTAALAVSCEGKRLVRTSLTSVRIPASGKAVDALRSIVVSFHDDVLATQAEGDDAVVQVVVSVVELARRPLAT